MKLLTTTLYVWDDTVYTKCHIYGSTHHDIIHARWRRSHILWIYSPRHYNYMQDDGDVIYGSTHHDIIYAHPYISWVVDLLHFDVARFISQQNPKQQQYSFVAECNTWIKLKYCRINTPNMLIFFITVCEVFVLLDQLQPTVH